MSETRNGSWFSGFSSTLIGNGIGRFGYITLMPILIQQGWFTKPEAAQLGAAALFGYLLGALFVQVFHKRIHPVVLLKTGMILCSLSYMACSLKALDPGFPWFYGWRFLAGFGGAMLIILAAPIILPTYRTNIQGRISGLIFSGIGIGAAISGVFIPLIAHHGVALVWLFLGGLGLVLTIITWRKWPPVVWHKPSAAPPALTRTASSAKQAFSLRGKAAVIALLIAYTLNAVGYLPHTLFWVDFLVRERHFSLGTGGFSWALFGMGAALGPLATGWMGDRIGFKNSLLIALGAQAFAVSIPLWNHSIAILHGSAFIVGLFSIGIVALVSTFTLELVGVAKHRKNWGLMTIAFALGQAVGGFFMARYIGHYPSYLPLFLTSALELCLAFLCVASIRHSRKRACP